MGKVWLRAWVCGIRLDDEEELADLLMSEFS